MKKQVLAISVIGFFAVLALSTLAKAESLHPDTFARIADVVAVDKSSTARVFVNESRKAIKLVVQPRWSCPEGMACAAVMPELRTIELPLISKRQGSCGQTIFVAKKDARPVDGSLELITVVDNTTMTCEIYLSEDMMTHVTHKSAWYDRRNGGEVVRTLEFSGKKLEGIR